METILQIIRDPAWQFAGIVVGAIVSFAIYGWSRDQKELAFGVLYLAPVVTTTKEFASQITVQYNGQAVQEVHSISFAIKNSGKKSIISDDFERDMRISLGKGVSVLFLGVVEQNPSNLGIDAIITPEGISIRPTLLNPGDSFVVRALTSGAAVKPAFDGRVAGVSKVAKLTQTSTRPSSFTNEAAWMLILVSTCLLGHFMLTDINLKSGAAAFALLFFVRFAFNFLWDYLRNAQGRAIYFK